MFNGKSIFISGGTGSFGRNFIARLLEQYQPKRVVVFSRDELKQYEMQQTFNAPCMRYFLGDVRDADRLRQAMRGIDYVVHAAALKQVPAAEYNPTECIRTNVNGAENIIAAAIDNGVKESRGAVHRQGGQPDQPVRRNQVAVGQAVRRRQQHCR
jgi:UDP-N-acetylglucosamine 4,6-dehydratase